MEPFRIDLEALRARARADIEKGALTPSYRADAEQVIAALNEVLATELVTAFTYRRHAYTASGLSADSVKEEFRSYAEESEAEADALAARIVQLNGQPDFNPAHLAARSHIRYATEGDLSSMIKHDLVAERTAIESYSEIIRWIGEDDPTSRRLLEQALERRERYAEDLASMIAQLAPR